METLEEIRAEVARIYQGHVPDRLAGMGQGEQAVMFDRIADAVLDEADQLAPGRAAAIREETAPIRDLGGVATTTERVEQSSREGATQVMAQQARGVGALDVTMNSLRHVHRAAPSAFLAIEYC